MPCSKVDAVTKLFVTHSEWAIIRIVLLTALESSTQAKIYTWDCYARCILLGNCGAFSPSVY